MMHPRVLFRVFFIRQDVRWFAFIFRRVLAAFYFFMESLILAQDERWRRA